MGVRAISKVRCSCLARPKSPSSTLPSDRKMFCVLTSRCRMRLAWMYDSDSSSCTSHCHTWGSGTVRPCFLLGPNERTMHRYCVDGQCVGGPLLLGVGRSGNCERQAADRYRECMNWTRRCNYVVCWQVFVLVGIWAHLSCANRNRDPGYRCRCCGTGPSR